MSGGRDGGRRWRGHLVSVEGVDGAGKSTQVAGLASALRAGGRDVLSVREPGETGLGEMVRGVLLQPAGVAVEPWSEALLFMAARAQLLGELVLPALERGSVVVCDRFVDSTLAYQGAGRGLGVDALRRVHADACGNVWPDLTVLLRIPPDVARARRHQDRLPLDRIEAGLDAIEATVADAFDMIAAAEPERVAVVDAARPPSTVAQDVLAAVEARLALSVPA